MLQLQDNPQETLTANLWQSWKATGYTERSNGLTWMELNNLAGYFLKLCRDKKLDYQTFDFQNIVDKQLNYYENKSALEDAIGNPASKDEAAYKAYMDSYKDPEKKQTTPEINTSQLRDEIKQINENQAAILNKLEQLPDLANKIEALKASKNFADLGNALSPITNTHKATANTNGTEHYVFNNDGNPEYCSYCGNKLKPNAIKCAMCGAPIKQPEKRGFSIPACLMPKKPIKPLDALAGAFTFLIWIAATGWILTSYAIDWLLIIELAVFWLCFIVAFRVMAGGILD